MGPVRKFQRVLAGLLLVISAAWAAPPELPLKDKVARADVVALVHVRSKATFPKSNSPVMDRRAILRVVTSYKGKVEGTEITVAFGPTSDCADSTYQPNDSWIVCLKRVRPGIYTTVNCHYGQLRPWEDLLDRVRKLTGPGTMVGSPLKTGQPLILVSAELSSKQWNSLRIMGLAPGMSEEEVRAAAGKPDRSAHGGRWLYWKATDVRVRFDADRRVDLIEGPALTMGADPLLAYRDQPEAAGALGKPYDALGSWKLYGKDGRFLAVRSRGERLARFCLTSGDQALRRYVKGLEQPSDGAAAKTE